MKLTPRQRAFAEYYIECGNASEAARKAGYSAKTASRTGSENLQKPDISDYIAGRMRAQSEAQVASADEVLRFFSSVMRGEVKDQFGLDAALSDRLSAGKELMKRYTAVQKKAEADIPIIIDGRPEA